MSDAEIKGRLEELLKQHSAYKPELLLDLFLTVSGWIMAARLEAVKEALGIQSK